MEDHIRVTPLPYKRRRMTFTLLLLMFLVAIPFLYLYATGYRFDFDRPTNLISTGGMYVAADRTGAEIFIDNELVRETRTFRKAFYAQNLDVGTHRVHVQKEDHHTWVKELPVLKHLVTESQAFNLPLVPTVIVYSKWESATGSPVFTAPLGVYASTTNDTIATTTENVLQFTLSTEYRTLMSFFSTTSTSSTESGPVPGLQSFLVGVAPTTTEEEMATSTVRTERVRLYQSGDDIYATWIGSFEQMPYYYCAEDFPPYSTSTEATHFEDNQRAAVFAGRTSEEAKEAEYVLHPVQTVSEDVECDPTIRIDRKDKEVLDFDFLPGSTDFVILLFEDGLYVVEIDDRSWQNVQPLLLGENLSMHIENGIVYAYDGIYIYQIVPSE